MVAWRLAPAKVNLFLHVGQLEASGYHPIRSLMVFADIGDRLAIAPAKAMGFDLVGPFAGGLDGGDDNLVPRARDLLLASLGGVPTAFALTLDKQLPVAAGLGGGSADAAATLKLVAEALASSGGAAPNQGHLEAIARELGADVAACLGSRSIIAEGRGDHLRPAPTMPPLDLVLANPGEPSSTAAVYWAFDNTGAGALADRLETPGELRSASAVAAFLRDWRNDLEASAMALQPVIGAVLAALRCEAETLLARMSGSGATCYSLCAGSREARRLADRLAAAHPTWWVRPCRVGSQESPRPNEITNP